MKTATEIKSRILNILKDSGSEKVSDILDCFSDNASEDKVIGSILKDMRANDEVRLVPVAIRADVDGEELDRVSSALNCDQLFFFVESV